MKPHIPSPPADASPERHCLRHRQTNPLRPLSPYFRKLRAGPLPPGIPRSVGRVESEVVL